MEQAVELAGSISVLSKAIRVSQGRINAVLNGDKCFATPTLKRLNAYMDDPPAPSDLVARTVSIRGLAEVSERTGIAADLLVSIKRGTDQLAPFEAQKLLTLYLELMAADRAAREYEARL